MIGSSSAEAARPSQPAGREQPTREQPPRPRFKLRIPPWLDKVFLLAGLGLLVWVVASYPLARITHAFIGAWPALLTLLVALGWNACNTSALHVLLQKRVRWRTLLWNRLVGDGYNSLLPLAGMGGEPFKVRHLTRFVEADVVVSALIRDRFLENAVGLVVTGVGVAVTMGRWTLPSAFRAALVGYAIVAPLAGVVLAAIVLSRLPLALGRTIARWLGAAATAGSDALPPRRLALLLFWLVLGRIVGLVEIGWLLHVLGRDFNPEVIIFVDSVLNAAGFIAFAIPQGLGVFEGTSVFLFGLVGYPGVLAVVFALLRRGRMLMVSSLGVLLHLGSRRRGGGRPQEAALWNEQYRRGAWAHLDSIDELPHYAVVAGYVQGLFRAAQILDLGCGTGGLLRRLVGYGFASYVGVDVSEEALQQARSLQVPGARFVMADFETHVHDVPADVVVFNESIYYARDVEATIDRHARLLSAEGVLIISIRRKWKNRRIWRLVARRTRRVHGCSVRTVEGHTWDIRVLRPDR